MARYDLESLLADLKAVCITGLNTKLLAIDAEKNDGLVLDKIADGTTPPDMPAAYFFQYMDKNAAGIHKAFVFYGAEDPVADGIGPHTLEDYNIYFIIVMRDVPEGDVHTMRLLRYSRALKEIFEDASYRNKVRARISVTSLTPVSFGIEGVPQTFKGVGVRIGAQIG